MLRNNIYHLESVGTHFENHVSNFDKLFSVYWVLFFWVSDKFQNVVVVYAIKTFDLAIDDTILIAFIRG